MQRLINADALLAECKEAQKSDPNADGRGWANHFLNAAGEPSTEWYCVEDMIENAPTVDAVPVVHAKWVFSHMLYDFVCSRCGAKPNYDVGSKDPFEDPDFRYCPYCGAKMDGPETEEVSSGRDAK